MSSIIFISVLSVSLLTIFLRCCITVKIFSYVDDKLVDDDVPEHVYKEMDTLYLNNYSETYEEKNDPVCNLSSDKKKELCDLIFKSKLYRKTQFHVSETAQYLSKLPCKRNRLVLEDHRNIDEKKIILQNMYPCHGRHDILWTSFIEDFYYNFFYLSSGPSNSVTVYVEMTYRSGYYRIVDYFYNVDLSKLQHTPKGIKAVTQELKTMRQIFTVDTPEQATLMYELEIDDKSLNEETDDLVCRLEYEKKITLCEVIINNSYVLKNGLKIALNKAATYLFNMSCVTKSVKGGTKLLKSEQRMYPCPVKYTHLDYTSESFLTERAINIVFLSFSPRRNAVFVYFRKVHKIIGEEVLVMDLLGNIDLKNIKSTAITMEEITGEFKHGYSIVKQIIENVEKTKKKELSSILMTCTTEEQENEMIEKLFFPDAERKFKNGSEIIGQRSKSDTEFKMKMKMMEDDYFRRVISPGEFEVGPQVYKRLLQKKKMIVVSKKLSKGAIEASNSKRIKKEVQKLIATMESSIIKDIEENLRQVLTSIDDKQLKAKSKKKKPKI